MVTRHHAWLVALLAVMVAVLVWPSRGPAADDGMVPHGAMKDVACAHCHDDPHAGQGEGGCASCHAAEDWVPSLITVADHGDFAFPLEGKHAETDCGLCHTDGKLTGLPQACNGCHLDRHRGKLGEDCAECHSVDGFTPVADFDHAARTGVKLVGFHGGLQCADCHEGEDGRALMLTREVTCETCHPIGHGPLGDDCLSCHPIDKPLWTDAREGFDHRVTGFPLERRHGSRPCVACHPVGGKVPVARCASCHDDPHSGQLSQVCSDCHRPDRWRLARFDHDRAGWTLRGRHFVTPCLDCHTNQRWMGLRTECWDCHALDARRAPPSVPAHVTGLADCSDCHTQWSWR